MIPWHVALICGLLSALLVVGVGGVALIPARRGKQNTGIDAFIGGVIALVLMGGYVIVTANDESFFTMLLGAGVATSSAPIMAWLKRKLS